MKPTIVSPVDVASKISEVLGHLATEVEVHNDEVRKKASETRMQDLLTMFSPKEARSLIRLIVEPRAQCTTCGFGRSIYDCSGDKCLDCAAAARRANESAA